MLALSGPALAAVAEPTVPAAVVRSLAEVLILIGCIFILAGAAGLLRFPDFYTRLHATTKLVTLGGLGLFGGAALVLDGAQASGRLLLIAVFFFLTAPLSGYMIARSGYLRGLGPYREEGSVDDWQAKGAAVPYLPRSERALPADAPESE